MTTIYEFRMIKPEKVIQPKIFIIKNENDPNIKYIRDSINESNDLTNIFQNCNFQKSDTHEIQDMVIL